MSCTVAKNDTDGKIVCYSAYGQLFVCPMGCLFNILSIITFCRVLRAGFYKNITTIHYLITICALDTVKLVLTLPIVVGLQGSHVFNYKPWMTTLVYGAVVYLTALLLTAHYSSIWIIIMTCAQRYTAIQYRSSSSRLKQLSRCLRCSVRNVLLVLLTFFIITFSRNFEYTLISVPQAASSHTAQLLSNLSNSSAQTQYIKTLSETEFGRLQVVDMFDSILYISVMYVAPFALLLVLCYGTVKTVQSHKMARMEGYAADRSVEHEQREHRLAYMVITIALLFLAFHSLAMVVRMGKLTAMPWMSNYVIYDVSNLLMSLHSALNPLVYFCFTNRFHDLFFNVRPKASQSGEHPNQLLINNDCSSKHLSVSVKMVPRQSCTSGAYTHL